MDDDDDDDDEEVGGGGIAAPVASTEETNSLPSLPLKGFIKNMFVVLVNFFKFSPFTINLSHCSEPALYEQSKSLTTSVISSGLTSTKISASAVPTNIN